MERRLVPSISSGLEAENLALTCAVAKDRPTVACFLLCYNYQLASPHCCQHSIQCSLYNSSLGRAWRTKGCCCWEGASFIETRGRCKCLTSPYRRRWQSSEASHKTKTLYLTLPFRGAPGRRETWKSVQGKKGGDGTGQFSLTCDGDWGLCRKWHHLCYSPDVPGVAPAYGRLFILRDSLWTTKIWHHPQHGPDL